MRNLRLIVILVTSLIFSHFSDCKSDVWRNGIWLPNCRVSKLLYFVCSFNWQDLSTTKKDGSAKLSTKPELVQKNWDFVTEPPCVSLLDIWMEGEHCLRRGRLHVHLVLPSLAGRAGRLLLLACFYLPPSERRLRHFTDPSRRLGRLDRSQLRLRHSKPSLGGEGKCLCGGVKMVADGQQWWW